MLHNVSLLFRRKSISRAAGFAALAGLLGSAVLCSAQTPNSLQLPYISTVVGSPTGYVVTGGTSAQVIQDPICSLSLKSSNYSSASYYTPQGQGDGCAPTQALLNAPSYTFFDSVGNLYIGDPGDLSVREVYNNGTAQLNTLAQTYNNAAVISTATIVPGYIYSICGPSLFKYNNYGAFGGGCNGTSIAAAGGAIDANGNIFSSEGGSRIRIIYNSGSVALNLAQITDGKNGPFVSGSTSPTPGTLYVGQQVEISGGATSLNGYAGDGGNVYQSFMNGIRGITLDPSDDIYVADYGNNLIRLINSSTGIITRFAGGGPGVAPPTTGLPYAGTSCTLATNYTYSVPTNNYTLGYPIPNSSSSAAPFIAGGCTGGFLGDGGPALQAVLNHPTDVFFDANNNLWIADSGNKRVRVVYGGAGTLPGISNPVAGYIYTVVGGGTLSAGPALQVALSSATGIGFDQAGNLYIADGTGHRIWEVDKTTNVAVIIAGNGTAPAVGGKVPVTIPAVVRASCSSTFPASAGGPMDTYPNGDGCLAAQAELSNPTGHISFDAQGNLYVADSGANNVREISRQEIAAVTTQVGSTSGVILGFAPLSAATSSGPVYEVQGVSGSGDYSNGPGSNCTGNLPVGIDCFVNVVFQPSLPGLRPGGLSLGGGAGSSLGSNYLVGSATGSEIALDVPNASSVGTGLKPMSVASDPSGAVYVADGKTGSVFKYANATATTPTATLLTGLSNPSQVFVDGLGNVLVADTGNSRIAIRSQLSGTTTYLTGFTGPQGVGVDGLGNLYVSDTGANRVLKYIPGATSPQVLATSVKAPTQISIDSLDNVYIVDSGNSRLVELPGGGGIQAAVATGTFIPTAAAVDAAGDLYVLDKLTGSVGFISAQGAVTSTLYSGLTTPANLSIDALGDVYVADSGASSALVLNRQQITTQFAPLNVGGSSAFASFVLTNIGNSALNFTGSSAFMATGSTAAFKVTPATTNGCSGSSINAGLGCSSSSTFTPPVFGSFLETLTFPTNAANTPTVTSTLLGSGVSLQSTTMTETSNPATITAIPYGAPITLTFTVMSSGTATPAGTVVIRVNGLQQAAVALKAGVATYTFTPQQGTYAASGQYSGDANYASSSASLTLTVVAAPTTTKLSYSGAQLSVTGSQVANYLLTATVASTVPVIGVVNFYSGTTLLGTAGINNKGIATLILYNSNPIAGVPPFVASQPTAAGFVLQNPTFTATYTGGANFAPSNSSSVNVNGDIGLAVLSTNLAAPQGSVSNTFLIITPFLGLNGTVSFSCTGLPANTLCRFLPNTLSFPQPVPTYTTITNAANNFGLANYYPSGGAAVTQVQLYTDVPSDLARLHTPRNGPGGSSARISSEAGLLVFSGLLFLTWRRGRTRMSRRLLATVLFAVLPALASTGLVGCSNNDFYNYPQVTTPVGSYTVTVVATSSTGTVESIPITLQVGAQ